MYTGVAHNSVLKQVVEVIVQVVCIIMLRVHQMAILVEVADVHEVALRWTHVPCNACLCTCV